VTGRANLCQDGAEPTTTNQEENPMAISMYQSSAPIFVQFLNGLLGVLDKAKAYGEAKKVDDATILNLRLAPDMFPLVRQVRSACDHAAGGCGRLAGVDLPTFANDEATIDDLKGRINKVIGFIKGLKASQIDGSENRDVVLKFPTGERKFTGQAYLLNFALPNFYFHDVTAYDILRKNGVDVGKRDYMSTPIQM
jgi:hypothetical protein